MPSRKKIGFTLTMLAIGIGNAFAYSSNDLVQKVVNDTATGFIEYGIAQPTVDSLIGYFTSSGLVQTFGLNQGLSFQSGLLTIDGIAQSQVSGLDEALGIIRDNIAAKASSTDATGTTHGLMSVVDKIKLDSLDAPPAQTITNNPSRTIVTLTNATGTKLSSSQNVDVMYNITIGTTATIGGGSDGSVYLEISPTNTATSTWTKVQEVRNGQAITLAIVLQSTQTMTMQLHGIVPAGQYVRLRSVNNAGTPTYTLSSGQEIRI